MRLSNIFFVPAALLGGLGRAGAVQAEGEPFKFQPFGPKAPAGKVYKAVSACIPGGGLLYTATSFPNPFVEPQKCTYSTTATHSWICDPDRLLTPAEQSTLESRLLKLRDSTEHQCPDGRKHFFQAAVAVAHDIYVPEDETPQQAADEMAHALLRRWGIGNQGCHDGMLLLFVKKRDVVAFAARERVAAENISEAFVTTLEARMHIAYLASGSAGRAVISGVDTINYQLPAVQTGMGWVATIIIALAALYLISVVVVYIAMTRFMVKFADEGEE